MKKLLRIAAALAVSLCMASSVIAEEADLELSPEEQTAKQAVMELKQEIAAVQEDMPEAIVLSAEDNWIYEEYELYREENFLPDSSVTLSQFSEYADESFNIAPYDASISVIRSAGKLAANNAASLGFRMVGLTFGHAFQDNPSDLTWNAGNTYSNDIKLSNQYKGLVSDIKAQLRGTSGSYWSEESSLAINDPMDVYLSLHNVDYLAAAEKVSGKWKIYIRFYDTYDFDYANASDYPAAIVTWANNWAADAQATGALVPYGITAYTQESY